MAKGKNDTGLKLDREKFKLACARKGYGVCEAFDLSGVNRSAGYRETISTKTLSLISNTLGVDPEEIIVKEG